MFLIPMVSGKLILPSMSRGTSGLPFAMTLTSCSGIRLKDLISLFALRLTKLADDEQFESLFEEVE